jgi:TolA-binding protein
MLGDAADAGSLWNTLATEHPTSPYAADAQLHLGDAAFDKQSYDTARIHYETLLNQYPTSPVASTAQLHLGSALYNLGRFSDAAARFDGVAVGHNAVALLPEALYWGGLSHDKSGDKSGALQRLKQLVTNFPSNTRTASAKIRIAALEATN